MSSDWDMEVMTEPPKISDGVLAVTSQNLLPCLIWKDIEVIEETRRDLTVVERFIIEAGLRVEQLSPHDVEEITSLPVRAARRFLLRLCSSGVFTPASAGGFDINRDKGESALAEKAVAERHSVKWSFVFLPRTDDLIAFPVEKLNEISRLKAKCSAPVPTSVPSLGRLALLRERIQQRRVTDLPKHVVDLPDFEKDTKIENLCPAYSCRGEVWEVDRCSTLKLWLSGLDKNNRESEHELKLSNPPGLKELWDSAANVLADPIMLKSAEKMIGKYFGFAAGEAPELRQRGPSRYTAVLTKAAAEAVFIKGASLTASFGLAVRSSEWSTELEISFKPDSKAAAALFIIDKSVALLLKSTNMDRNAVETAIREGVGTDALGPEDAKLVTVESVLDRLWVRGQFDLIYSMRYATDFNYEQNS
jgi:hypothetical protein